MEVPEGCGNTPVFSY